MATIDILSLIKLGGLSPSKRPTSRRDCSTEDGTLKPR